MSGLSAAAKQPLYALGENDIALWVVHLAAVQPAMIAGTQTLSATELAAASRYRSAAQQAAFLQRRVALRALLAGYLGAPAEELQFTENEFGKPALHTPPALGGWHLTPHIAPRWP